MIKFSSRGPEHYSEEGRQKNKGFGFTFMTTGNKVEVEATPELAYSYLENLLGDRGKNLVTVLCNHHCVLNPH